MHPYPYLVEGRRGLADRYETRHAGVISVVDGNGLDIASAGDTRLSFPLRSTSKPFQLLPYLLDGLHCLRSRDADEVAADLAVMMSSHAGEEIHTSRVSAILGSLGLDASALLCGAHWPYDSTSREALLRADQTPSTLHSNCSGKHAGMLSVCAHRGWPLDSYLEIKHPLQVRIHDIIVALTGEPTTPLPVSIDGCSLPTFWVSMRGLARMYASLACPSNAPMAEDRGIGQFLEVLYKAGTDKPEFVGGTERFDTRLMQAFEGRVFGKSGAAGVYAMAIGPCPPYPTGLGIGFKVEDGDMENRIRPIVACEILSQLGLELPDTETMMRLAKPTIRNVRDLEVGEYQCVFRLKQH